MRKILFSQEVHVRTTSFLNMTKSRDCHSLFSLEKVKGASNYKIIKIIKSGRSLDLAYQLGAMTRRDCHVASLLTMTAILFSFNAQAECTPTPDCASIGYTETSCETDYLACPFDSTKLKCMPCDSSFRYDCVGENMIGGTGSACGGKYASCECSSTDYIFSNGSCVCDTSCKVGAIYYSDGSCYSCVDTTKTAVGVVVKDNELVMSNITDNIQWGGYSEDIPDLTNYKDSTNAQTDVNGKANTNKIVEYFGENTDTSLYAGVFCYQYAPTGMEKTKGQWNLPAAGELYTMIYGFGYAWKTWVYKLNWSDYKNKYLWSSTEWNSDYSWPVQIKEKDMQHYNWKYNRNSVTCFLEIN